MTQLLYMLGRHFLLLDKLAQRVAVDIIGDNAASDAGYILEIIYHYDIRMRQTVAHIKLLLYHGLIARVGRILGLQSLDHNPLAELACGIDMIELFVPLGEMFNFGPAWSLISHG